MSDRLDDIVMNLFKMGSEESFNQHHTTSGTPRLNRSTSFYSPISKKLSPSSEHLTSGWPVDIWSETLTSKQFSSRPDRSMSLTEAGALSFNKLKTNEVPPPPGFPPLNNQAVLPSNRYKTELCRSFQENGSCKYGSKCQFAHGESELRGLYRHPKYKTEACRTFYNFGYCPYGTRCHFLHEEKPQQHQNEVPATHQHRFLRQSVSFAGFLGSRSSPPPTVNDTLGFTRAPSVSPPPVDLLSPVFSESGTQSMKNAFQFCQSRPSLSDIQNIPQIIEPPKSSCCVCGHGNNFTSSLNKFYKQEDRNTAYVHQPNLQRSPSEDSLSDRDSYSSTGSTSGSESPTFDGLGSKRLTVFERLSLSD
ncbi:hypothetical protein COCON_G00191430 [Conger conger]|uniref:mRNA decay activator protein ZFP36 n=1 Tax=Conger conger TaxID=82655 RepID=A0A9Q1D3L7_CONCO|nr:mRNA decay activator protein ZFP36 [Conger conger]KAJ8256991.1 hypothetical protein COCON_G00191430 [Conger conger]